jgi:hypothetical protein
MAAELATRLDRTKYEVIYKLHPGEFDRWKSDYPWLSEQSLTLIDHSEVDIHHYLAHANIQIGVYSTAIYEGLGYGLRTFIWKLPEYERMQELLDSKIAELVCNCDELIERLNTPEYPSGKMNISSLWKPNSLSNILNEINKAMR